MYKKIIIGMGAVIVVLVAILIIVLLNGQKPAHEHSWSEWQISKQATCTVDGLQTRVCNGCSESQSIAIYATGHKYGNWTITKKATCTVNGTKERSCNCGDRETETIVASHTWQEATCVTAKTCEKCNLTEGNALGHTWQEATCVTAKTCKKCNLTEGNALGHTWQEATCVTAKTCEKCNLTEGNALGHTCNVGEKCTRCNKKVEPIVHMPSTPFTTHSHYGTLKITKLSYHFDSNGNIILTLSGEKIAGMNGGYTAFNIKVIDNEGYVVYTSHGGVQEYNVGDKFRDYTIKIRYSYIASLSEFTIVFEDH